MHGQAHKSSIDRAAATSSHATVILSSIIHQASAMSPSRQASRLLAQREAKRARKQEQQERLRQIAAKKEALKAKKPQETKGGKTTYQANLEPQQLSYEWHATPTPKDPAPGKAAQVGWDRGMKQDHAKALIRSFDEGRAVPITAGKDFWEAVFITAKVAYNAVPDWIRTHITEDQMARLRTVPYFSLTPIYSASTSLDRAVGLIETRTLQPVDEVLRSVWEAQGFALPASMPFRTQVGYQAAVAALDAEAHATPDGTQAVTPDGKQEEQDSETEDTKMPARESDGVEDGSLSSDDDESSDPSFVLMETPPQKRGVKRPGTEEPQPSPYATWAKTASSAAATTATHVAVSASSVAFAATKVAAGATVRVAKKAKASMAKAFFPKDDE